MEAYHASACLEEQFDRIREIVLIILILLRAAIVRYAMGKVDEHIVAVRVSGLQVQQCRCQMDVIGWDLRHFVNAQAIASGGQCDRKVSWLRQVGI